LYDSPRLLNKLRVNTTEGDDAVGVFYLRCVWELLGNNIREFLIVINSWAGIFAVSLAV